MSHVNSSAHTFERQDLQPPIRVLIIPGLRDSGPDHWQTWLQGQYRDATRVVQQDWHAPDLHAWSARIEETIGQPRYRHVQWVAVAHSFGCLALAHHLARQMGRQMGRQDGHAPECGRILSALMVAPADPLKFEVTEQLPQHALGLPLNLIGSEDDPWMPLDRARAWARQWRAVFQNLGQAGHINAESGFGPWPLARHKVDTMIRLQQKQWRLLRQEALAAAQPA